MPKTSTKKSPKATAKKPVKATAKKPAKAPAKKPVKAAAKKPVKTAAKKPVKATAKTPVKATAKTPVKATAKTPVKAAAKKPAKAAAKTPATVIAKSPRASAETSPAEISAKPSAKAAKPDKKGLEEFQRVSKEAAGEIMQLLCKQYPDAECELIYQNPFQLLISVILSAQTTDANVNRATPQLFKKFPTPRALAEAPIDEVKNIIRSTGYFNSKAQNIQSCAQALVTRFGGEVPRNIDDLTTLPGVGRKTANVVLGVAFGVPGWTVDAHVQRLSYKLGFSDETDPAKIEKDLQQLFPEADWTKYSITLIWHGRRCCYARNPNCAGCPVNRLCPSSLV